ncbi:TetR family transcriptional regulator [Caballeronia fortuita]|uniref:TetR family transcriptional regulator n=1 Tax=Caballeronia fortuita TaxID=1777138 RepID=A0A158E138_9BURK|nr:TetR/AcrR family transcriptional regulator [Caballeronia fortuita]SAL00390.1 TetR family transcriptional regulator [Caballeronia fortuita]
MVTNLKNEAKPGRGRPRSFDPETALAIGQQMFHAADYDAVGLSALTNALGVTPPSFYTAFGSKAAFFASVLERYASTELALAEILREGRRPEEALTDLFVRAARTYSQDPGRRGCLVLEAARGHGNSESAVLARRVAERRRAQVREFIARTHPRAAGLVTDYVSSVMSGLSGSAREGMSQARLVKVARAAGEGLARLLG